MKNTFIAAAASALLTLTSSHAMGAGGGELVHKDWSFNGVFGEFDKQQLQRGFKIYSEICAGCHSLEYVAFRNLEALGYSEDQVKVIAENWIYMVEDGPNDDGEMYERAPVPADRLPGPYPNEQFARMINNGALPPDLSLMAKARAGGPDYIYSLLTGYEDPPEDVQMGDFMYYNTAFGGNQISMAPPLYDDLLVFEDGREATVSNMAEDVSAFLMWAAEPKLEARKQTGFRVLLFTLVFTILAYFLKRKIWSRVDH